MFANKCSIDMLANKCSIDKTLKIHKKTLQIVYEVYDESYENLLNRNDNISIHQKHLRYLAIEVERISFKETIILIIYDEVTYYFYRQLNLLAMVLIL